MSIPAKPRSISNNSGGRMSLQDFRQGLRALMALEFEELGEAGVFADWQAQEWQTFRRDPFRSFFYADEETTDTIWRLLQLQQKQREAA